MEQTKYKTPLYIPQAVTHPELVRAAVPDGEKDECGVFEGPRVGVADLEGRSTEGHLELFVVREERK